jgi:hypothetical protein
VAISESEHNAYNLANHLASEVVETELIESSSSLLHLRLLHSSISNFRHFEFQFHHFARGVVFDFGLVLLLTFDFVLTFRQCSIFVFHGGRRCGPDSVRDAIVSFRSFSQSPSSSFRSPAPSLSTATMVKFVLVAALNLALGAVGQMDGGAVSQCSENEEVSLLRAFDLEPSSWKTKHIKKDVRKHHPQPHSAKKEHRCGTDGGALREYWLTISEANGAPDGVERTFLAINGSSVGPVLEADLGDCFTVHVTNMLVTGFAGTTIHWHGQTQPGTPFFDGVRFDFGTNTI